MAVMVSVDISGHAEWSCLERLYHRSADVCTGCGNVFG